MMKGYIKKPLRFHFIECGQCDNSFFSLAPWSRKCADCHLAYKRRLQRERMRRLRSDPILGPSIKVDDLERLNKWKQEHPEYEEKQQKINKSRREARKRQLPATLTVKEWERTLEYFELSCAYCGEPSSELEQEHFVPVAKGGGYTKCNIVPACSNCNQSKSDALPQDWLPVDTYTGVSKYLLEGVD